MMLDIKDIYDPAIFRGQKASALLDTDVFREAVGVILQRYSEYEENILLHRDVSVDEANKKILLAAQMRRSLLDVVAELNSFVREAENSAYEQDATNGD